MQNFDFEAHMGRCNNIAKKKCKFVNHKIPACFKKNEIVFNNQNDKFKIYAYFLFASFFKSLNIKKSCHNFFNIKIFLIQIPLLITNQNEIYTKS